MNDEGWGWPPTHASKAHYFVEGQSLCGAHKHLGLILIGSGSTRDDPYRCMECLEKLKSQKERNLCLK